MELTPDLLLEAKFSAARRGYDMAEVDDFLERCAEGLDVLLTRLRAEFERAERCEAELASARAGGGAVPAPFFEPSPEPEVVEPEAESDDPDDVVAASDLAVPDGAEDGPGAEVPVGEPMRILIHAERTAEAAIADAKAEAARIRAEAESISSAQRTEAETMLERARSEAEAEARRAGNEIRRSIQGEVVTLRRDRDSLNDDIRMLRRWLDDQRGRLRTTARDLQRLAEDPAALRDIAPPDISDVATPTFSDIGDDVGDDDPPSRGLDGPAAFHDGPGSDGEPTQAVPRFGEPPSGGTDADDDPPGGDGS